MNEVTGYLQMGDNDIVIGLSVHMQAQQNLNRNLSRGFQKRITPCKLTKFCNFRLTFVSTDVHPDQQGIH